MPTRKEDAHVRLTDDAYFLLTEKAKDHNVSQKEIASAAIFLMFSKEKAQEDCIPLIEEAKRETEKEAALTIRKLKKIGREIEALLIILGILTGMAFSLVIGFIFGVI